MFVDPTRSRAMFSILVEPRKATVRDTPVPECCRISELVLQYIRECRPAQGRSSLSLRSETKDHSKIAEDICQRKQ